MSTVPGQVPPTSAEPVPPPDPTGLARFALTAADLPGWTVGPPRGYDDGDSDSSLLAGCPARTAVDLLGRSFELEIAFGRDSAETSWQYIGEVADAMTAVGLVHEFAALADCAIQLESVSVTTGGGLLDVPAASAAAVLELSIDGPGSTGPGEFRLVALAAGPRVTALAFSSTGFGAVDPAEIDLVVGIAAAKLAG